MKGSPADNRPVLFRKAALKNSRDLLVCGHQRMVLKGTEPMMLFGVHEVLVQAVHFVNHSSVLNVEVAGIEFFRILLDRHELVYAEAAACESFLPSPQNLAPFNTQCRNEIFRLYPKLRGAPENYGPMARCHIEPRC